jgi:hypothetical protein
MFCNAPANFGDTFYRWPATRVQKNDASLNDLRLTIAGAADAALWIKPKCASSTSEAVCVSEFQGAACYPYCMALRAKGSGSSRLILFNEPNWKVNLFIYKLRACIHIYIYCAISELCCTYIYILCNI